MRQQYERVNPLFAQMRTLREQGRLTEARTVALQMIQAAEEEFGPNFMYIFEGRLVIGESYAAEHQYAEADEVFQHLLIRMEDLSRSVGEGMGKIMLEGTFVDYSRQIAAHYKAWGDLEKAQAALEKALPIAKAALPDSALANEIAEELTVLRSQKANTPMGNQ